jgi:hypothetical protein
MITAAALTFPRLQACVTSLSRQPDAPRAATVVTCSNATQITIYNCRNCGITRPFQLDGDPFGPWTIYPCIADKEVPDCTFGRRHPSHPHPKVCPVQHLSVKDGTAPDRAERPRAARPGPVLTEKTADWPDDHILSRMAAVNGHANQPLTLSLRRITRQQSVRWGRQQGRRTRTTAASRTARHPGSPADGQADPLRKQAFQTAGPGLDPADLGHGQCLR